MTTTARFTCNYQMAGYAFGCRDEIGPIDFGSFVEAFNRFPWGEQMTQREKMAGGCSATISVVDHEQDFVLWVSSMGAERRPTFLIGAVYSKNQRKSARVTDPRVIRWSEIRIAPSRRSVPSAFRVFFSGDTGKLTKQLRRYKLFEQGEARDPFEESRD